MLWLILLYTDNIPSGQYNSYYVLELQSLGMDGGKESQLKKNLFISYTISILLFFKKIPYR